MKALILAGGSGTRLWPLSRSSTPKQFLKLTGDLSFLQLTVKRLYTFLEPEEIYVITSADYHHMVVTQVPELEPNIILEPVAKNTGPAIALSMQQIDCDELLVVPSDHLISPNEAFCAAVQRGSQLTQGLVTFGVRPTRPETGYGYIEYEDERVLSFVEKPDQPTAMRYLMEGSYLWNSGIFLFKKEALKTAFATYSPEIAALFEAEDVQQCFHELPSISIDYAIMEKSNDVGVIPLELNWSDVGSWESFYDTMEKDQEGNVVQGNCQLLDTRDCVVLSNKRLVTTVGLKGVIIVETDDALLVAEKERAQEVKEVVEKLKAANAKEAHEHLTMIRPWGSYTVLEEGPRFKMKRIYVEPLQKLSLQLHYHRSEHWVVVSGTARVTIQDEEKLVHEGESIFVPKSSIHRIENPGKVPLEILEVQVGEYLGEDDIVRLEDVYGRLKDKASFKLLIDNR